MAAELTSDSPLVAGLVERRPAVIARAVERHAVEDASAFVAGLPRRVAAVLLHHLNPDMAARILEQTDPRLAAETLRFMDPVDAAFLVERLQPEAHDTILAATSEDLRRELESIVAFPPESAARLMDANVTRFAGNTTVEVVLDSLRRLRGRRITDIVVVRDDGAFAGTVAVQDLLQAHPEDVISAFLSPQPVSVHPMATREEVVELFERHRRLSLPVVDSQHRVLGIIRQEGLIEAAQQAVAGDAQQMFGASAAESALSPPLFSVKSRLPWLNINLVTAFAAAAVVGLFEGTLARFTALAVLLPVVAGQSGNTGAQALAVTMRSLALREIRPSLVWRVLGKELTVGLINGLAISVVTSAGTLLWSRSLGLSLVMLMAMILSMVIAGLAGALIPILLARAGRDPAVASSIILTTVTDIAGFLAFLGLATLLADFLTDLAP